MCREGKGKAEKGPATLPEETLVCKYESVTKGCSKEECMYNNADITLTMDASKQIQKPSRIPEITYAFAAWLDDAAILSEIDPAAEERPGLMTRKNNRKLHCWVY